MILTHSSLFPKTNPSDLIRLRDSIYATDLLITAIGHLDFFTWLENEPSDFEKIIKHFNLASKPADVMLTLFKSLELINENDGIYKLTALAEEQLSKDSELNLIPYFLTQLERPTVDKMYQVLKTGKPESWASKKNELDWTNAMEKKEFAEMFTSGMDSRGAFFAPGLANSFDFSKYKSIIDIGGASGIYVSTIKSFYPEIISALLEKPPIHKIAEDILKKKGFNNSIEIFGLDMFSDKIPKGFDIHLYSHVFHDWDSEENKVLIKNSFENLNPGGIIMIHDAHLNNDKTGPLSVAEYSVLLMFSTHGKCYSITEIESLLVAEGFRDIKFVNTIGNRSIITGKKI